MEKPDHPAKGVKCIVADKGYDSQTIGLKVFGEKGANLRLPRAGMQK